MKNDFKKFVRYSLPSTLSMLIAGIYTLVDGLFIGWGVGANGLAAINVAFPFYCIYLGLGEMLGNGCAITMAYCRGRSKRMTAGLFFGNMITLLIPVGLILAALSPVSALLVRKMGADSSIHNMAYQYALIIGLGCLPQIAASSLLAVIRHDGKPFLAMSLMLVGLLANILLDYLWVIVYPFGVAGSAYATILAQTITMILAILFFRRGTLNFAFRKRFLRPYADVAMQIAQTGFPSMGLQLMGALLILLHNIQAQRYGGLAAVSAYAIISYLTSPVLLMSDGIALGIQPPVSYYHGTGEHERKRKFLLYGSMTILTLSLLAAAVAILADRVLPGLFHAEGLVARLTTNGLFLSALSFPPLGVFQVFAAYYQAVGRSTFASLLIYSDCFLALPAALFLMPLFFGLNGVWAALAVSKLIMVFLILLIRCRKGTADQSNPGQDHHHKNSVFLLSS